MDRTSNLISDENSDNTFLGSINENKSFVSNERCENNDFIEKAEYAVDKGYYNIENKESSMDNDIVFKEDMNNISKKTNIAENTADKKDNYKADNLGTERVSKFNNLKTEDVSYVENEDGVGDNRLIRGETNNNYVSNNSNSKISAAGDTSSFTKSSIYSGSSNVKSFTEKNNRLPNYVTISNKKISMSDYLYLASKVIINDNKGISSNIIMKDVKDPSNPSGDSISGKLYKNEYVNLAQRVVNFIDTNGRAPNLGSSTIGKIQFQTIIYGFAKILDFKKSNNALPNYVSLNVKSTSTLNKYVPVFGSPIDNTLAFSSSSPMNDAYNGESLDQYLKATKNCDVTDSTIVSLAKSITSKCTTELEKASAIYSWMEKNIDYSFYYNTVYGSKKTITMKKGNCVDQSHLLIALSRASGLAARYVHGKATFKISGNTIGHVWAQIKIGNVWVAADTTNSKNTLGVINSWHTSTVTIHGKYSALSF